MNPKTAVKIVLAIIFAVTLFHICILVSIIPYEITWGGQLKNHSEMIVFETISILVNLILIGTLLIKGGYVKSIISLKVVHITLWIYLLLFGLNTIGNLFAATYFEKSLSIITLALAVLIGVIIKPVRKEKVIIDNE